MPPHLAVISYPNRSILCYTEPWLPGVPHSVNLRFAVSGQGKRSWRPPCPPCPRRRRRLRGRLDAYHAYSVRHRTLRRIQGLGGALRSAQAARSKLRLIAQSPSLIARRWAGECRHGEGLRPPGHRLRGAAARGKLLGDLRCGQPRSYTDFVEPRHARHSSAVLARSAYLAYRGCIARS